MTRRKMYYNLSQMSDDQITRLMDSISSAEDTGDESNDGNFDSDDDVANPNFVCEHDELMFSQSLLGSNEFSKAIQASINISGLLDESVLCTSSSPTPSAPVALSSPIPSTSDTAPAAGAESLVDAIADDDATDADPAKVRLRKRKREHYQTIQLQEEEDGPDPNIRLDSTGFSYAFEVYSGAGDNIVPENAPNLGASSNVVIRLSAKVPNNLNHIVYFDNFYTSLGLLAYLRSRGIYSLGTVRPNRVPNIKVSTDSELSKEKVARGYSEEYVGNAFGIDISNVLWQDNKPIRLLSTYVGVLPFLSHLPFNHPPQKSKRWDRKTKTDVEIDCPYIIKEYNRHMGGVDLMDGLLGRYHIRMKTKKWINRIFYHLLDVTMANAYILYQRLHKTDTRQQNTDLPNFRAEVAESLCRIDYKKPVGRPSLALEENNAPRRVQTMVYRPTPDVRYDNIGHWCIFLDRTGKKQCKFTGCKSETQAYCTKCKLNLCNSTAKQCFLNFHKQ